MARQTLAVALIVKVRDACPIKHVSVQDPEDINTVAFTFKDSATPEQVAAASAIIASFDPAQERVRAEDREKLRAAREDALNLWADKLLANPNLLK